MSYYEEYKTNYLWFQAINNIHNMPDNSILSNPSASLLNNSFESFDDLYISYNEKNKDIFQEDPFFGQIIKEEKSTGETDINIQLPKQLNEKFDDYIHKTYNLDDIIYKLKDDIFKKLIEKGKEDQKLKKAENDIQIINKKRKRDNNNLDNQISNKKYERGRKKGNDDSSERKHNKFSADNIIKKIKTQLFNNLIKFVNGIIFSRTNEGIKKCIKKVKYKEYADSLKKDKNINDLHMSIKDILSYDISKKYSSLEKEKDYNKKKLESISKEYNNDKIINFVFNMKFVEWINIFLSKKKVKDFGVLDEEECKEFEEYLPEVNNLLEEIKQKNDEKYLSHFIFYLYNFENWFYKKNGRTKKKNNNEI